jgi:hypothetical protein
MNKRALYWLCQTGGWTLFVVYELSRYPVMPGSLGRLVINGLVNVLLGIGITHLYRMVNLRQQWVNLPIRKLVPRALVGTVFITFIMAAINLPMDAWMFPEIFASQLSPVFFLYSFMGWGKYILIWTSLYHLFHYSERSARIELEKTQMERLLAEMELQRLRSQLNPHFLFNALNSLRALVLEDPKKAQAGLTKLAGLLRQALRNDRQGTVPLNRELQTVRDYLELESLRLEDRLALEWDLAPGTDHAPVPAMLLLTLVENAIKHGIATLPHGGTVRLRSRPTDDGQRLVVELFNTGTYQPPTSHDGFGLLNSQRRLALTFGPTAGASLNIQQHEPNTVLTTLTLPLPPAPAYEA